MTQPPENTGGQPAGDWSPDDQDARQPASAPPPGSWHFPYGGQPPYGAPSPGAPPQYGAPPPYGAPPHSAPPPYGTSPQYGNPPPYNAPYGSVDPSYAYPAYAAGGPAGPEPDLAEWWRRLLGRLIDGLVLSIISIPLAFGLLSSAFNTYQQTLNQYPDLSAPGAQAAISKADGKLFGGWLLFAAIVAVISFLYDSLQHGLWGQTLGKRALGTRVVSAYDRSKISGGAAAGRAAMSALLPVIPLVGSVYWLLDALWLLWDRRRQCLHDKPAHTIVVKTRYPAAGPQQPDSPW